MNDPVRKSPPHPAFWIGIAVAIGCGVGVALRNPALGIGLAVAIGAIGMLASRRKR